MSYNRYSNNYYAKGGALELDAAAKSNFGITNDNYYVVAYETDGELTQGFDATIDGNNYKLFEIDDVDKLNKIVGDYKLDLNAVKGNTHVNKCSNTEVGNLMTAGTNDFANLLTELQKCKDKPDGKGEDKPEPIKPIDQSTVSDKELRDALNKLINEANKLDTTNAKRVEFEKYLKTITDTKNYTAELTNLNTHASALELPDFKTLAEVVTAMGIAIAVSPSTAASSGGGRHRRHRREQRKNRFYW